MTTQNFGLIREGTGNAVLRPIPMPKLRDDYILVRTVAIALNPTDWTTIDAKGDDGTIVGCDYSGIVEEVGSAVTKPFEKGDRISGFSHGGMRPCQRLVLTLPSAKLTLGRQRTMQTLKPVHSLATS